MIQRIQTIYLGVAAVMLVVAAAATNRATGDAMGMTITGIGVLLAVISLGAIFLYSNRARQRQIVRWTELSCLALMHGVFLVAFLTDRLQAMLSGEADSLVVASVACLVALGLLHMAASAIQKDILLVRSMDRIR